MDQVIGQARAVEVLASQVAADRVHHAQIFHGPRGVGKFTTAIAFARLLLCHSPLTDLHGGQSACSQCPSCTLMKAFDPDAEADGDDDPTAVLTAAHPDLHLITKELALFDDSSAVRGRKLTNIPVKIIREHMLAKASLAPKLSHGKVFIVDEAELLAREGQNAMLKTLEEPTPGTTLILVTSQDDRLLPTIRSRCQRVAFGLLSDEEVGTWLTPRSEGADEKTIRWVIGFAHGSLGRAAVALRYDLVQWGQSVLSPIHRMAKDGRPEGMLGSAMAKHLGDFAEAWVKAHKNASKLAANRIAFGLMSSMIANFAQRRISDIAATCDPETPGDSEAVLAPWLGIIEAVEAARQQLDANVSMGLVCEGMGAAINAAMLSPSRV